ncbi:MAG TPA: imelysin family protein [Polyangiaceae bacterium]|nr:imelysin family protein [Polyangiaceae bacterium]
MVRTWALLFPCLTFAPLGCNRAQPTESSERVPSAAETARLRAALATYAELAYRGYSDAARSARALETKVDAFVANPSAAGLAEARNAWLRARHPYQQTEVFRFYDGPIDALEMRINTWPIDEAYVDGTGQTGKLGIIDDGKLYPELSTELLAKLNAKEGETSISTGYHVVEFLLWGTDTSAEGPGDRPYTDYAGKDGERATRRGRYLRLAVELLVRDLETVRDAWAPGRDNYRAKFLASPPMEALGLAIKGMGALGGPELAGERLSVAYETKAQENEHSCFSDNTVSDLTDDALGIQNVCLGRYEAPGEPPLRGAGLCDAVAQRDSGLAGQLR